MALFDGPRDLSLSLSLFPSVLSVRRGSLKFRGVEHEKMRETGEKGSGWALSTGRMEKKRRSEPRHE